MPASGALPGHALIRQRRDALLDRMRRAAREAGRDPDGFRIVAVTKTWPVEVCREALAAGLTALGESRVQEAIPKIDALPTAEWHLVGHLQGNKARAAVEAFGWIHSIDSLELLERVDRVAAELGRHPRLLLQVNLTAEPTKRGFDGAWFRDETETGTELVRALERVHAARVVGLMTIAEASRPAAPVFADLRRLRGRLGERGIALPELSMGMTGDAEEAVREGATLLRIGTALFGERASA